MGGKSGHHGPGQTRTKIAELEEENRVLQTKVKSLTLTNAIQCQRLGQEELLRIRITELEARLQKDETE